MGFPWTVGHWVVSFGSFLLINWDGNPGSARMFLVSLSSGDIFILATLKSCRTDQNAPRKCCIHLHSPMLRRPKSVFFVFVPAGGWCSKPQKDPQTRPFHGKTIRKQWEKTLYRSWICVSWQFSKFPPVFLCVMFCFCLYNIEWETRQVMGLCWPSESECFKYVLAV